MGKRSIKENKNVYQLSRENQELTRESASELMTYISADRIEKIESEKVVPHPDEVLTMEQCYKNPELSNYYCTHECPIGMKYVPEAKLKTFAEVTVELISSVNSIEPEQKRLIDISVDGRVNDFERKDFDEILKKLNRLDRAIQEMRIWIEHASQTGKLDDAE